MRSCRKLFRFKFRAFEVDVHIRQVAHELNSCSISSFSVTMEIALFCMLFVTVFNVSSIICPRPPVQETTLSDFVLILTVQFEGHGQKTLVGNSVFLHCTRENAKPVQKEDKIIIVLNHLFNVNIEPEMNRASFQIRLSTDSFNKYISAVSMTGHKGEQLVASESSNPSDQTSEFLTVVQLRDGILPLRSFNLEILTFYFENSNKKVSRQDHNLSLQKVFSEDIQRSAYDCLGFDNTKLKYYFARSRFMNVIDRDIIKIQNKFLSAPYIFASDSPKNSDNVEVYFRYKVEYDRYVYLDLLRNLNIKDVQDQNNDTIIKITKASITSDAYQTYFDGLQAAINIDDTLSYSENDPDSEAKRQTLNTTNFDNSVNRHLSDFNDENAKSINFKTFITRHTFERSGETVERLLVFTILMESGNEEKLAKAHAYSLHQVFGTPQRNTIHACFHNRDFTIARTKSALTSDFKMVLKKIFKINN